MLAVIRDVSLAFLDLFVAAQSLFSSYLMLYTWEHPERLEASRGPSLFTEPKTRFTILLPARHEQKVIYGTILRVMEANYPKELMEVVLICSADDRETIAEGERAIRDLRTDRVRVVVFHDSPINKPHGLNKGLASTSFEVVTIFDSEDDVHPDILNVVNTLMEDTSIGIVQSGVQLMNLFTNWFSVHNCMEYYFWFKSRLHLHAALRMVPLGGNTVFIRRDLIEKVGGWNEHCLTEDAEIGLALSALGEPIRVVYHADHVTKEETPPTAAQFIKQRTRWHQGFIQLLLKGTWTKMPTMRQKALAAYTFSSPIIQAIMMLTWPLAVASFLWLRLPVPLVMLSFVPLITLSFQYWITVVGVQLFCREYQIRAPRLTPIHMALTFLPFQFMQGIAAVRAVYRMLNGQWNWEKTAHVGAHRLPQVEVGYSGQRGIPMALSPVSALTGVADSLLATVAPVASPGIQPFHAHNSTLAPVVLPPPLLSLVPTAVPNTDDVHTLVLHAASTEERDMEPMTRVSGPQGRLKQVLDLLNTAHTTLLVLDDDGQAYMVAAERGLSEIETHRLKNSLMRGTTIVTLGVKDNKDNVVSMLFLPGVSDARLRKEA